MNILGFQITKASPASAAEPVYDSGRSWWPIIRESFTGAWQRNITVDAEAVRAFHAVFACETLIASDIAKLRVKLVAQDSNGIWSETTNSAYSPVLRKPNRFQTRIQFWESWVLSKLSRGNTYVLKERDNRKVVKALYVLDPCRVKPMVTPDGAVYYELRSDNLAGLQEENILVPASEIIHDRFNCLFHPLVGLSPIYANGLAATQGLKIQNHSANFFENGARPGGILTAPGRIHQETADRLKKDWDDKYSGPQNAGKIAVLGDGLKYEQMVMTSVDAQLIEQLKWSSEVVCSTYHVPPYKIGIGQQPTYNNVQALNTEYYSQCLQVLIESIEVCLDEGLATGEKLGTEFDTDNLLRMDSVTQMETLEKSKGILTPNEQRAKLDKPPKPGGDSPMLQQQNYSLEALSKRDAQEDPFGKSAPAPVAEPANDNAEARRAALALFEKDLREALNA